MTMLAAAGTAAAALAAGSSPDIAHYPAAPKGGTIDDHFGVAVADPYRGLEDLDAPATRQWVSAEDALTHRYFEQLPRHAALRARLRQLYTYDAFGIPFRAGPRLFYTYNPGTFDQPLLYTMGLRGESPRVVLDPNGLSADGHLAVFDYVASQDGHLIAYGVTDGGSDWVDWHIRDVERQTDLPDVLRHTKYYRPQFAPDNKGLYYSAFPAPPAGQELIAQDLGNAVFYHALGEAGPDRKVLEFLGHADWQYEPHLSDDGRWLTVAAGEGEVGDKGLVNIYLLDLQRPGPPATLMDGFRAEYIYAGADAGRIFFLTNEDAPNGRVISIAAEGGSIKDARAIVAESKEAIDLTSTSVTIVDHRLIVRSIERASSRVRVYGLDGRLQRTLALPEIGTAEGFEGRAADASTYYKFANMLTPGAVYRYDLESGVSRLFRGPKMAFNAREFEQHQVFYPARDGTRIPMLLGYRRGLKLDGSNPVVLYGYGGFGIPLLPWFDARRIAWFEQGGVFAIANVRGGGEYGEAWHLPARREHKQLVFDDFMDAARWLVAQRYTRTDRLAIEGDSNGGLLIGACLTQHPELFAAAVARVGVLDMLRFDRFGQGAGWIGEYGSPQAAADFPFLYAYSPLHHIHDGTRYPAALIVTGDHDTRVMPMHSFKFAATLQQAQAGPAPILLYLEQSSGHGGGPTLTQKIDQAADTYAFLIQNLGMASP